MIQYLQINHPPNRAEFRQFMILKVWADEVAEGCACAEEKNGGLWGRYSIVV